MAGLGYLRRVMSELDSSITTARVIWESGDIPTSPDFADKYYNRHDPVGESRHAFLDGADVVARWRDRSHFAIAETGFGTGLNFLITWDQWRRDPMKRPDAWLTYLSVEKHPMREEDRTRALRALSPLGTLSNQLAKQMPPPYPGPHRIVFPGDRVRLILVYGDAAASLSRLTGPIDAWYLDGFAPSRNPDMWRPALFDAIARLSAPSATLASFTAASAVRKGLEASGFAVTKRPGFGGKRESITACYGGPVTEHWRAGPWFTPATPLRPATGTSVAVIGAGIAGLATARVLKGIGLSPVLLDRGQSPMAGASGLPAALIAPKLNRDDGDYARFWIAAFLDAVRTLDNHHPSAWCDRRGLVINARDAEDRARQEVLIRKLGWDGSCISLAPEGLSIPSAGSISPPHLAETLTAGIPYRQANIARLAREAGEWCLYDADGGRILRAPICVLAGGAWLNGLLEPEDRLPLRAEFGCVAVYPRAQAGPHRAILDNGYVTATDPPVLGAALRHGEGEPSDWTPGERERARLADTARRLGLPEPPRETPWHAWRATSPDHLPLVGPVPDAKAFRAAYAGLSTGKRFPAYPPAPRYPGLLMLGALGPRGFQAAFLSADLLASRILGWPLPVDAPMRDALDPARFLARALRKGG